MGRRRGSALAARFRSTLDRKVAEEREREQRRLKRMEEARVARTELLEDIVAFGEDIGHFDVAASRGTVVLRYQGKAMRFEPKGDADLVTVTGDGLDPPHEIFLHSTLDRWTLRWSPTAGREEQCLLFDAGLERLLKQAFGLVAGAETSGEGGQPPGRSL